MAKHSTRTRALLGTGALLLAGGAAIAIAAPGTPSITSGPSGFTNNPTQAFGWASGGNGSGNFIWSIDNTAYGGSGPATSTGALGFGEGTYTFRVVETPVEGDPDNSPQATRSFTVDTTAPQLSRNLAGTAGSAGWFRSAVTVTYACSDNLDPTPNCPSGGTFGSQGQNTIPAVSASDSAGNVTPQIAAQTVSVDSGAPTISVTSPTAGQAIELGSGTDLTFAFTCADGVSGITPANCVGSPVASGEALDVGSPGTGAGTLGTRTVQVTATDNAGNTAQAARTYTVQDTQAPAAPALGQPREVTKDVRPTFTWAPSTDAGTGVARYDLVVDAQTAIPVTGPPGPTGEYLVTWPADRAPLSISSHTWRVRAVDAAGNVGAYSDTIPFTIDPNAPSPPAITAGPRGFTRTTAPTFTFTGLAGTTFTWELFTAQGTTPLQQGSDGSGQAVLAPLADGQYRFDVTQKSPAGVDSPAASALFTVDTIVPSVPAISGSPGTTGNTQPQFSWTGTESGATFRWIVTGAGGETRLGPGTTSSTSVTLPAPLPGGAYVFRVRQIDQAGNESDWSAPEPFTVVAAPGPSPTGPVTTSRSPGSRIVPTTRNARLMTPRAGTKVTTMRPLLKWRKRTGATLYNVQVYRVAGTRSVKVLSVFPRGTSYRVPLKRLKRGERYVWRVWPYLGGVRRYTGSPLGVSWFDVSPKAITPGAPVAGKLCPRKLRGKATEARNGRIVRCVASGRTQRWRYR